MGFQRILDLIVAFMLLHALDALHCFYYYFDDSDYDGDTRVENIGGKWMRNFLNLMIQIVT